MTKIDINAIKPGDQVQDVSGEWYTVEKAHNVRGYFKGCLFVPLHPDYLTAHKPAAAPEPVWVPKHYDLNASRIGKTRHESLNEWLTEKYGPPPVVKTATGEEEGEVVVLYGDAREWVLCYLCDLDPGDRYVELPKCCGEEK